MKSKLELDNFILLYDMKDKKMYCVDITIDLTNYFTLENKKNLYYIVVADTAQEAIRKIEKKYNHGKLSILSVSEYKDRLLLS